MYDLAIVGAGPAGATLARLVGGQYRTLLVDRRRLRSPPGGDVLPGKCCGGLLAPDAQAMLSRLGLGLPSSVMVGPQLFVVRVLDFDSGLERYYQRYYINIRRDRFDAWLLSLLPAAVDLRLGVRFRGCERHADGFKLILSERGRERCEYARALIGADGADSAVRRHLFPTPLGQPEYIAVQEIRAGAAAPPHFSAIFDRAVTDYYCWAIPKDGALLVGAALRPRNEVSSRMARLVSDLQRSGFDLGRSVAREGAFLRRPLRPSHVYCGAPGIALVGEAGGWISPSSSEGLSYALRSAVLLNDALGAGLEGMIGRYRARMRGLRLNICLKMLKSRLLYQPLFRRLTLQTGIRSLELCGNVP